MPSATRAWKAIGFTGGPWASLKSATAAAKKQNALDKCYIYNVETKNVYDVTGEEIAFMTGSQRLAIVKLLSTIISAAAIGVNPDRDTLLGLLAYFKGTDLYTESLDVAKRVIVYAVEAHNSSKPAEQESGG